MAQNRHFVGTLSLLFPATASIELTVGGGLGCPDGSPAVDDPNGVA